MSAKPEKDRIRKPRLKDVKEKGAPEKRTRKPDDFTVGTPRVASSGSSRAVNLASAAFAISVHDTEQLPPPGAPEVAFAGRSNAGKSSAINTLTGRRRLAFASKTPGRTQLINFFALGDAAYLVDLPGYGYAGVPLEVRKHWEVLVGRYVAERESLAGVVLMMDARHPLTPLDHELLAWLAPSNRPVHVLLTKSDKLSKQAAQRTLQQTRSGLSKIYGTSTVQLFSSLKREGLSEATAKITEWVRDAKNKTPPKGE
jgi:GTP-binding protein